jgi:hypothetical protein
MITWKPSGLRVGAFAVAIAVAAASHPVFAQPYYVKASTRVQTAGFGISDPQFHVDISGQVQALSMTCGPFTATSTAAASATATAYAKSDLGALHASGSISASSIGAAAGGDSQATGEAWSDTFTATSNTLPIGTPVNMLATLTFHRTLSASNPSVTVQTSAGLSGPFSLNISDSLAAPNPTQSVSTTFSAFVGSSFAVTGSLYFQVNGSASGGGSVSGSIDVSNTATFTLVSLNPAATYSTASGVNYVPEPASIAIAGIVMVCIGLQRPLRPSKP